MPATPIYLDFAAATPVDPAVITAMKPFFADKFYNPSANYQAGRDVRMQLNAARAKTAHWLGAKPSEIIFTAGGTEANNLAVHGIMQQCPDGNIVVSSVEHDSVLLPAQKYDCRQAKVLADGRLDLDDLRRKIDKKTVLVSVMYANSEIGTVQPLREIGQILDEKRSEAGRKMPLYFHTDACQAANYLDLHAKRLGVDMLTINGGKIYGPKQSGALYLRAGVNPLPLIYGGGQERGLRSGTENVAGAIGLAAALEIAQNTRREEAARLRGLQADFIKQISTKLPDCVINGSAKWRLPNNIHLTLPGKDNERLLIQLDEAGIMAAAGSACSASDETPSHVLKAIGLSDEEARASLRFTMGRPTTAVEINRTINTLSTLIK